MYNVGKHTFVGSKEAQQQEVNAKKEAAVRSWGACKVLLYKFEEAVGGGRVAWPVLTHSNGLSFLQTTFKG